MSPLPPTPPWFVRPASGDVPVGSVIAYAGPLGGPDTVPPKGLPASPPAGAPLRIEAWGWMPCDGRSLEVALYPELFLALGYLYGGGGGNFALPDYRGYFLRGINRYGGVDGSGGVDPDVTRRQSPPGSGGASDGVGSTQGAALWSHVHGYAKPDDAGVATGQPNGSAGTLGTAWTSPPVTTDDHRSFGPALSAYETRPVNVYVNYIIKFTGALRGGWEWTS